MTNEEIAERIRELTGEAYVLCHVCGEPVARASAVLLELEPTLTAPPEQIWVCPDCQQAIERGEVDLELIEQEPETVP